jgi:hypothetical protein
LDGSDGGAAGRNYRAEDAYARSAGFDSMPPREDHLWHAMPLAEVNRPGNTDFSGISAGFGEISGYLSQAWLLWLYLR